MVGVALEDGGRSSENGGDQFCPGLTRPPLSQPRGLRLHVYGRALI